jgi:hypothetical protein
VSPILRRKDQRQFAQSHVADAKIALLFQPASYLYDRRPTLSRSSVFQTRTMPVPSSRPASYQRRGPFSFLALRAAHRANRPIHPREIHTGEFDRQEGSAGILSALSETALPDRSRDLALPPVANHRVHHEATDRADRGWRLKRERDRQLRRPFLGDSQLATKPIHAN